MTGLRRELHRMLTTPSRYVNPWVLAVCVIMSGLFLCGFVVCIAFGHWVGAAFNFLALVVYIWLTYAYWPWRKL
jgi:hypothetical protein